MKSFTFAFVVILLALSLPLQAQEGHFQVAGITDANHAFLATECRIGERIPEGADELASFDPDGVCAGVSMFDAEQGITGVALWRDDPETDFDEGFEAGDRLVFFKFWDSTVERELDAEVQIIEGNNVWTQDGFTIAIVTADAPNHFECTRPTEFNHSVLAQNCNVAGRVLRIGDEVGAFDPDGVCGGVGVFEENEEDGQSGIALWSDDPNTERDEGFEAGDRFTFRFWDSVIHREMATEMEITRGPETWESQALTVVNLSSPGVGIPRAEEVEHDFGLFDLFAEEPVTWTALLFNEGNGELQLGNFTVEGDTVAFGAELSGDFISADDTSFVEVSFTFPTFDCEPGRNYEAFITLGTSDLPVVYHLLGQTGAARFVIDRDTVDMGGACAVDDGYETPQQTFDTIRVTNPGNAVAMLRHITFDDSAFQLAPDFNDSCLLWPGEELAVPIIFDPWDTENPVRNYHGYMQFDAVSSEPSTFLRVWLTGEGVVGNGIDPGASPLPKAFGVLAYPNPFNGQTVIAFDIDKSGMIDVAVFDLSGRRIATVEKRQFDAGRHSLTWNAESTPAGVYIVKITGPSGVRSSRMALVR